MRLFHSRTLRVGTSCEHLVHRLRIFDIAPQNLGAMRLCCFACEFYDCIIHRKRLGAKRYVSISNVPLSTAEAANLNFAKCLWGGGSSRCGTSGESDHRLQPEYFHCGSWILGPWSVRDRHGFPIMEQCGVSDDRLGARFFPSGKCTRRPWCTLAAPGHSAAKGKQFGPSSSQPQPRHLECCGKATLGNEGPAFSSPKDLI